MKLWEWMRSLPERGGRARREADIGENSREHNLKEADEEMLSKETEKCFF